MFRFENNITLLFVSNIFFLRHEVQTIRQCIKFPLLEPRAICDDKLQSRQGQCSLSSALIQNTNCYEILQVLMVYIHNEFMLSSFKQMMPQKASTMAKFFITNLIINLYMKKFTRTEANRMKKIIFSKLWEHNNYPKINNVHLQDKRFGRV